MKKLLNGDLAVCGIFALFIVALCTQMPKIKAEARIYPIVLMVLSLVFMIVVVIQALTRKKTAEEEENTGSFWGRYRRAIGYSLLILAYVLLLDRLGFLISTILFAVCSLLYQKKKNLLLLILLPLISAFLMYFVFKQYLFVTLPTGSWIEALMDLF